MQEGAQEFHAEALAQVRAAGEFVGGGRVGWESRETSRQSARGLAVVLSLAPGRAQGFTQRTKDQLTILPSPMVASSTLRNLQVPPGFVPTKEAKEVSGRKQPL